MYRDHQKRTYSSDFRGFKKSKKVTPHGGLRGAPQRNFSVHGIAHFFLPDGADSSRLFRNMNAHAGMLVALARCHNYTLFVFNSTAAAQVDTRCAKNKFQIFPGFAHMINPISPDIARIQYRARLRQARIDTTDPAIVNAAKELCAVHGSWPSADALLYWIERIEDVKQAFPYAHEKTPYAGMT